MLLRLVQPHDALKFLICHHAITCDISELKHLSELSLSDLFARFRPTPDWYR